MFAARTNEITSADGGWPILFTFLAQWRGASEFIRSATRP